MTKPVIASIVFALAQITGALAGPQVSLNGSLGKDTALLVIDGQVRSVRVGQTVSGVRVLEVGEGRAVVDVAGQRLVLGLGGTPVAHQGSSGGGARITLTSQRGGHFMTQGSIAGHTVQFMVDTGATSIAISQRDAQRMGLRYLEGQRIQTQTANGAVPAWLITVDRVRIGEAEVSGVAAVVVAADMPFVLLGNSFLSRFHMKRENDTLVLEKRY